MSTRETTPPLTPTPHGVVVFCASAAQQQTLVTMLQGAGYDAFVSAVNVRAEQIRSEGDYAD